MNYRASTMADARYWKKIQSRALSLSPDAEHGEAKAKVSNPYKFGDLHAEPRIGIRVPEGSGAICKCIIQKLLACGVGGGPRPGIQVVQSRAKLPHDFQIFDT